MEVHEQRRDRGEVLEDQSMEEAKGSVDRCEATGKPRQQLLLPLKAGRSSRHAVPREAANPSKTQPIPKQIIREIGEDQRKNLGR